MNYVDEFRNEPPIARGNRFTLPLLIGGDAARGAHAAGESKGIRGNSIRAGSRIRAISRTFGRHLLYRILSLPSIPRILLRFSCEKNELLIYITFRSPLTRECGAGGLDTAGNVERAIETRERTHALKERAKRATPFRTPLRSPSQRHSSRRSLGALGIVVLPVPRTRRFAQPTWEYLQIPGNTRGNARPSRQ